MALRTSQEIQEQNIFPIHRVGRFTQNHLLGYTAKYQTLSNYSSGHKSIGLNKTASSHLKPTLLQPPAEKSIYEQGEAMEQ